MDESVIPMTAGAEHATDAVVRAFDRPLVSIIMPIHNAAEYLEEAFDSVCCQTYRPIEVSMFNDRSTDTSWDMTVRWKDKLKEHDISVVLSNSTKELAQGPGYSRNQCVSQSTGEYLCNLDSDDRMEPCRVAMQLARCLEKGHDYLVGSNFTREPEGSTAYYTDWLNGLDDHALLTQRFRECTIICPTWFMHRSVFDRVSQLRAPGCSGHRKGYAECADNKHRVSEDLSFFLDHLSLGGKLTKVGTPLLCYRYHHNSWCFGTKPIDMQRIRIQYLQDAVLDLWPSFSIWGYGKDGRKFINMLSEANANKVVSYCDVDENKIGTTYFCNHVRKRIPIISFKEVVKPFIICVGTKRTGGGPGGLEENVNSLGLVEGVDYFYFC
jgi:glycosyltransferase involved in cell wall biosynthesis